MYGLKRSEIKELKRVFDRFEDIQKVVLFGSRAKGNFHDGSDIDLAIIGTDIDLKKIHNIEIEIDKIFLPYKTDLLNFSKIKNQDLIEHINRVGIPIYKKYNRHKSACLI